MAQFLSLADAVAEVVRDGERVAVEGFTHYPGSDTGDGVTSSAEGK